jgi:hypothetical protein
MKSEGKNATSVVGPQTWPATHTHTHPNFDYSKHYAINQSTTSLTLVGNDARGAASPCPVQLGGTGHGGLAVGALVVRIAHACTRRGARAAARAAARGRGEGRRGRGNDGRYTKPRATAVNKTLPQSKLHQHSTHHTNTCTHTHAYTRTHANTHKATCTHKHAQRNHTHACAQLSHPTADSPFPKTITNTSSHTQRQ